MKPTGVGLRLGAHVSVAGGVDRAPANAAAIGAEAFQIFTRNQQRWTAPPLDEEKAARFRDEVRRAGYGPLLAHDSYLVNLATNDRDKLARSRHTMVDELSRAATLGVPSLVAHPGSHLGAGVAVGIERLMANMDSCLEEAGQRAASVRVLLETTAGQGTNMGSSFEELRDMISASRFPDRLAVCCDSCHLFAAGYDLSTEEGYEHLVETVDRTVGVDRIAAWHLNDSKRELGSRRDRHAALGEGEIGLPPFRRIVCDSRWNGLAGCLETPGGPEGWVDEIITLRTMREGSSLD